jgi:hypothetical protein
MDDLRLSKALLNGLFVWLISAALTALPGIVYSVWRSSELVPRSVDALATAEQVAREVAALYAGNPLLTIGLVAITAVLVLWRASAVAKGSWTLRWANGLLVGVIPAVFALLSGLCGGLGVPDLVTSGVYLLAGLVGGLIARAT